MEKLSRILHDLDQGNINVELAKQQVLDLVAVSQRSKLLSDFEKWLDKKENESYCSLPTQYVVDKFKSLNCG